jgi:para-nitrobenzyl esterase
MADSGRDRAQGRREFLKAIGVAAGGAALIPGETLAAATDERQKRRSSGRAGDEAVRAGAGVAEAETAYGRVAGYVDRDILTFKGVPYGDTTGGVNRFKPPRPPKSWAGVRSSRSYGPICPQDQGTGRLNDEEAFLFPWVDAVQGEDCLRLNVWTPGLAGRARPVMVWLHGGGFEAGSGHDLDAFDGRNLAARGDVVVVTLNHRLNLLGFMDLSDLGADFAQSANAGMLDIVAALAWVRDNIAAFGGDPGRVTIFGQSGGGAKVSTLMGMPAAKGLFHRAIVQSGSFSFFQPPERSRRLSALVLKELGIESTRLGHLGELPYAELRRAADAVLRRENRPGNLVSDSRRSVERLGFSPVVDGAVLPAAPFAPGVRPLMPDVPMIIGTTLNEFASGINHPEYEQFAEADAMQRIAAMAPGRAEAVYAAFRKRTPRAKPFDIWSRIASASVRQGALTQASAKAAQGGAPAWLYWFTWQTPVLDGRPRAFHCAEIPFTFANAQRCARMTGGGPRALALEASIADAWIAFARAGDPNHPGLPAWKPFGPAASGTMIFDDACRYVIDIDREELASVNA